MSHRMFTQSLAINYWLAPKDDDDIPRIEDLKREAEQDIIAAMADIISFNRFDYSDEREAVRIAEDIVEKAFRAGFEAGYDLCESEYVEAQKGG